MSTWVINVGTVIVITTVAGFLVPDGKLGKYVKGIFSLLVLLVMIKPIFSINIDEIEFSDLFSGKEISYQEDYLDYIYSKNNANCQEKVNNLLKNISVENADVKIYHLITNDYEFQISKVTINLKNAVINSDKEHIDIIDEIKKSVSNSLSIDYNSVEVNGYERNN